MLGSQRRNIPQHDMPLLIPPFILEQYAQGQMSGRFSAVSLFADITGFSTVTNTLMQHGDEAAEAMANVMLALFGPLVRHVQAHGGFITGFAGDAFTALFPTVSSHLLPVSSYQRALAAAVGIQRHVAAHPSQATPYGTFPFAIKLGLADGDVEWGILVPEGVSGDATDLGDKVKATYFFSGPAIDAAAAAEHVAQAGDLVLSAAVHKPLAPLLRADPVNEEDMEHLRLMAVHGPLPTPRPVEHGTVDIRQLAAFVPHAIRQQSTRHYGRGEFRQVLTLFIQPTGIENSEQLVPFVQSVFCLQQQYGGYLNSIDFGDKGCNLLLFWGAPISFENDVERALNFILDLGETAANTFRAGLTYCPVYAGLAGSSTRGEFSCYGDGINLAARLMMAAPWGDVWLDENVARRAERLFSTEMEGYHAFKGFAQKQPVYRLRERQGKRPTDFFQGALVGRQAELAQLEAFVQPLLAAEDEGDPAGRSRFAGILTVVGEAGLGKSHLVHEFLARPSQFPNFQTFLCQTDQTLRQSLNPFRYWLHDYFEQSGTQSELRKQAFSRKIETLIAAVPDPALQRELSRTRSFLGALVDLYWDDSLYARVDAKGRFENTLIALKTLIKTESLLQPVIIHLEDAHWLDEDSITLTQRLVYNVEEYPFAIIATARPEREGVLFGEDLGYQEIALSGLSTDELSLLATTVLGTPASPALVGLLAQRAEGNPFFAEQILFYLGEQDLLDKGELLAAPATAIPTDVRAVLIARLDRLAQKVKDVVQTAAVLGREFEVHVLAQMLHGDMVVPPEVGAAEQAGIWAALSEMHYLFKHALLRDTAYGMQLRARRRQLHQLAAEAMETLHKDDLPPHYGELAYHYEQAFLQGQTDLQAKAWDYMEKAGQLAAENYENAAAVDYFSRALALTPESDYTKHYALLLAREKVYDLQGVREAQARDLAALEKLSAVLEDKGWQAEVALHRALYADATSDYLQAAAVAQTAIRLAQAVQDVKAEATGYLRWGQALWRQGFFEPARSQLKEALELAQVASLRAIEARILQNLGNIFGQQGDYAQAEEHFRLSLYIYREVGNRRGEGMVLNNLGIVSRLQGDYAAARAYYQQSLRIRHEIGDPRGEGALLGNLGQVALDQDDYVEAKDYLEQSLHIYREVGSRQGEGYALGNLGTVHDLLGNYVQGREYLEQALRICSEIGDRRGESLWMSDLGLLFHHMGDNKAAREYCQQALLLVQDLGERSMLGAVLTYLGHVQASLGHLDEAAAAYRQSVEIRRELGQAILATEGLAGLARVSLVQGQPALALAQVEEILSHLESNPLEGVEEPLRIYLTCYHVLQANENSRAQELLNTAHDFLQERAAKIDDEELRHMFLHNVAACREILELFAAPQSAGE